MLYVSWIHNRKASIVSEASGQMTVKSSTKQSLKLLFSFNVFIPTSLSDFRFC